MTRHRRCLTTRGSAEETARAARSAVSNLAPADVLWVSPHAEDGPWTSVRPPETRGLLGRSYDAVVLDCHQGLDADTLGRCHGFVWGGGALILRLPESGHAPTDGDEKLAALPFVAADVTHRFWHRFERCLAQAAQALEAAPLAPADHATEGTAEQAEAVERMAADFGAASPQRMVLTADRGRGKSSALGLALTKVLDADASLTVAVTAGSEASAGEVFRFADATSRAGRVRFVAPVDLAYGTDRFDIVIVDEAAQVAVPLLQAIALNHRAAHLAFATTTHGYEGTGRGFALRFVQWLKDELAPVQELALSAPIRWDPGDPLERFVFEALGLDAEPPAVTTVLGDGGALEHARLEHRMLDRDRLAQDERLLHDFFGLLVHAHYRTTPADLHRILDAPNLELHALLANGRVVAGTLVAKEGGLSADLCRNLARGHARIRGHALADTLVCHCGRADAGELSLIRSVRIATHPELRRRGLARRLIGHIHESYDVDAFGTLFGATPELLAFRRAAGYRLVRLGASRGSRTGEPAAVMMRPVSERAHRLVDELQAELARDLPLQLELLNIEGELRLSERLQASVLEDLPPPAPLDAERARALTLSYAYGSRPYESAARGVMRYVADHAGALDALEDVPRRLIEGRVRDKRAWLEVTPALAFPTVHSAMRALRRAIRALVAAAEPGFEPDGEPL